MNIRLKIILFLFLVAFVATIGRLFFLQVLESSRYEEAAEKQQVLEETVKSRRGSIFFQSISTDKKKYIPAALSKRLWRVWVSPRDIEVEKREEISSSVADILSLDREIIMERISKENDPYEPLKEGVDEETIKKIENLNISAIYWEETDNRYYPLNNLASHLIGFLGRKGDARIGQYGLEEFYEETLSGTEGYIKGFRNSFGFLIKSFSDVFKAKDGADLYLTVDYNIQLILEKELTKALNKFSADAASGIVMNPSTGAIIAMASIPSFNPNKYNEVDNISIFLNPNTQKLFEPGSVFKPITMAIGLDINVISPDLTYRDEGFVKVGNATIKNSTDEVNGIQTMTQVLEKSLNTGVVFVVNRIPPGVWNQYLKEFGLSERTGIDIVGEVKGDLRNVRSKREVELATSSFGQGIAVTPIELITAISAIANRGKIVEPYFVEKIIRGDEIIFEKNNFILKRQVIREEVAETVTKMMVSVIENGFGTRAKISGYSVAGKTGTAQVPGPDGKYSDKTIHSFLGFAPAFNPEFAIMVRLDNPQGDYFSDRTITPVFKEVAEFILHYYGVEPDKPIFN